MFVHCSNAEWQFATYHTGIGNEGCASEGVEIRWNANATLSIGAHKCFEDKNWHLCFKINLWVLRWKSVQLTTTFLASSASTTVKLKSSAEVTISTKRRSLCCGESSFTAKLWQNISAKVYLTTMCRVKNDAHQQTTMTTTTTRIAKDSNSVASWWHNAY